jgi:hypothetical protein
VIDVHIRYPPGEDPVALLREVRAISGATAQSFLVRPPATFLRSIPEWFGD